MCAKYAANPMIFDTFMEIRIMTKMPMTYEVDDDNGDNGIVVIAFK